MLISVLVFASALFWSILSGCVALAAFVVGGLRVFSNHYKNKGEGGLSLYVNFVDDLQQELSRLHDQIIEERQENIAKLREKDLEIERKEVVIQGLREEIAAQEDLHRRGL
jgi:hypothetical protein